MKRLGISVLVALSLAACNNKNTFTVNGTVEGAKDSVLYLYHNTLSGAEKLDSVKLGDNGKFSFSSEAPQYPDLYCLNIDNQIIYFGVDSTETITINAQYPNMAQHYQVEGSENSERIRELTLKQQELQRKTIALERNLDMGRRDIADSLQRMVQEYKHDVMMNYIFRDPAAISSYFALFQTLGPWNLFDRSDPQDVKVFAAVATSWDTFYHDSERARHLHNTAIKGMNDSREAIYKQQMNADVAGKVETAGMLELQLPDATGKMRTLSELHGKVVLLDFHVFNMKESAARILSLRELYNKFHNQGLEIYQVGLDDNEHFWKQQTNALPWVSVYDPEALSAQRYNVQALPEFFLIDRNSNLYKRSSQMQDVEEEIKSLLGK